MKVYKLSGLYVFCTWVCWLLILTLFFPNLSNLARVVKEAHFFRRGWSLVKGLDHSNWLMRFWGFSWQILFRLLFDGLMYHCDWRHMRWFLLVFLWHRSTRKINLRKFNASPIWSFACKVVAWLCSKFRLALKPVRLWTFLVAETKLNFFIKFVLRSVWIFWLLS